MSTTPLNPALLIAGPAILQFKNKVFYTKDDIRVTPKRDTFAIATSQHGEIENREASFTLEVRATPVGRLDALAALWPYGIVTPGALVHATATIVSVDTGTEIVTFDDLARFRDGAPVVFTTHGTLPTGLSAGTTYFLHKLSSTTGTLHTTEANALAATSAINLSATGTGAMVEQEYLIVHAFNGDKYTFHNAAVVASPEMNLTAGATPIGEVTWECFRKFAVAPTNAASLYTKATASVTDTSFAASDIVTEVYDFAWGASAPWSAMNTPDGIRVSFPLNLAPITDDTVGVISRRITSASASVKARPLGITVDQLLAKLTPQDTGAGRGRRLTSSDALNISGSALYVRLYGPQLTNPGFQFSGQNDRVGELEWIAARTYSAGVAQPLYYVGAAAPS